MVSNVTKRDGSTEPFDAQKIRSSIEKAAVGAGVGEARAQELMANVANFVLGKLEGMEEVSSSQIKEMILSELDTAEPSVSEAWRKHEQIKGQ